MRVHHLFFSTNGDQQTLHRCISPTAAQMKIQQERWQDLRDFLVVELGQTSGYAMSSWLQGSYKFGTQIRPARLGSEFDIDLGLYYNWAGGPEATGEDPADLKAQVQATLEAYAAEAGEDVKGVDRPAKERCARIRFSGDFHIDVPAYHLDPRRDARELATETHNWESSDPKAFYLWFQSKFDRDDTAQVRRLIRYMKMWSALRLEAPPSSVLITVLVSEAYLRATVEAVDGDDLAIRTIAEAIRARLSSQGKVANPVNTKENLNRMDAAQTVAFLSGLAELEQIADRAMAAPSEAAAALTWTEAFAHFFPAATERAENRNALVPIAFDPEVWVEARPNGGSVVLRGVNDIGTIPKACVITFTLQNAHLLPPGAQIRWIVRNEGEEAELTNDMGHIGAVGPVAVENSAYRGSHAMDVVVLSSQGVLLGSRRVRVQVSGVKMPPRNPSRPGWARRRRP